MKLISFLVGHGNAMAIALLLAPVLVACAKGTVPVSVHGVNYSAQTFSYSVEDPNDKKNTGGGELIEPFGAGGTMCCYELPKKWRPGIKIQVNATHWLPKKADGSLPEVAETMVVELPPYADGKAGELWVLRDVTGKTSVISSDYQPDHAKWPGNVKGWPVPSLAYRRERWNLLFSLAESDLVAIRAMRQELDQHPDQHLRKVWDLMKEYRSKDLIPFSGPDDPMFHKKMKQESDRNLENTEQQLKQLQDIRP